jgi:NADPH-dependent 2,4-dienoyl-CoA reductase/sulfur reductase-like enzyme
MSSTKVSHLTIIGAGPAGLGAAIAARKAGLRVTVIDDQYEPGGQIWRSAGSTSLHHATALGAEYLFGRDRIAEFRASGAEYLPEHTLWQIEYEDDRPVLHCAGPDGSRVLRPDYALLATGAVERPVPVPGWTLPGVMTAGGLQILLKSAQLCPTTSLAACITNDRSRCTAACRRRNCLSVLLYRGSPLLACGFAPAGASAEGNKAYRTCDAGRSADLSRCQKHKNPW